MVKPYSGDLRERVIAAVEKDDLSCREAARRYRVSPSSAVKWLQHYRRFGRTRARPMGGDRRSVLKPHKDWLLMLIAREKDLTLIAMSRRLRVSVTLCKKVSVSLPLRRRLACLPIFHLRFWTNCLATG
jgi:putative transposase